MASSVNISRDKDGNVVYRIDNIPDKPAPDLSAVGTEFRELNVKGLFCYGLKVIVKLIKHFGYDFGKWREFLTGMSDYTLIDEQNGVGGRCSKHWEIFDYSPNEILIPIIFPKNNIKNFYPCDNCGQAKWLYGAYEDESFCLNFKNCGYVRDHYRYNRPDKNQYSVGKYKEYYDLYMETDIDLLRVIYDTMLITDYSSAYEMFDGDRMPIIADILGVCKRLGIEPPDLSGIPEEGFDKDSKCLSFDCISLIEGV